MKTKIERRQTVGYVRSTVKNDCLSESIDEMIAVISSFQPRINAYKRKHRKSGK